MSSLAHAPPTILISRPASSALLQPQPATFIPTHAIGFVCKCLYPPTSFLLHVKNNTAIIIKLKKKNNKKQKLIKTNSSININYFNKQVCCRYIQNVINRHLKQFRHIDEFNYYI